MVRTGGEDAACRCSAVESGQRTPTGKDLPVKQLVSGGMVG